MIFFNRLRERDYIIIMNETMSITQSVQLSFLPFLFLFNSFNPKYAYIRTCPPLIPFRKTSIFNNRLYKSLDMPYENDFSTQRCTSCWSAWVYVVCDLAGLWRQIYMNAGPKELIKPPPLHLMWYCQIQQALKTPFEYRSCRSQNRSLETMSLNRNMLAAYSFSW